MPFINKYINKPKLEYYIFNLTVLLAFLTPFHFKFNTIPVMLMLLCWVLSGNFKEKIKKLYNAKVPLLFMSLYVVYFISLSWSDNYDEAFFHLFMKSPILIFPLILCSTFLNKPFSQSPIFKGFIIGCLLASLTCIINAFINYPVLGLYSFYYTNFSMFMHPAYFSSLLILASCIIIWYLAANWQSYTAVKKVLGVLIFFLFASEILVLASRIAIITFALINFIFIFYFFKRKLYIAGIAILLTGVLASYAVGKFARMEPVWQYAKNNLIENSDNYNDAKHSTESITVRLLIWEEITKELLKNPLLGVGIGDARDELIKLHKKSGLTGALKRKLNAHNQFLQTAFTLGIIGLLILISCLLLPFIQSIRQGRFIYPLFLLAMWLFMCTESIFEQSAGVHLYAFFNAICWLGSYNKN